MCFTKLLPPSQELADSNTNTTFIYRGNCEQKCKYKMGTMYHFVLTVFLISQSIKMLHARRCIFVKNKAQKFADEPISSDSHYYTRIECSIRCAMHDTCKGFGWANGACVLHYDEFKLSWKQEVYTKVPIYCKIALILTFFTNISFRHGCFSMTISNLWSSTYQITVKKYSRKRTISVQCSIFI